MSDNTNTNANTNTGDRFPNLWVHTKTGNHYKVLGFCYLEATGELAVRYMRLYDENKMDPIEWIRHIGIFMEKFEPFKYTEFFIPAKKLEDKR